MNNKEKEVFKFIMQTCLWWVEDEDIYTIPIRDTFSDECIEDLLMDVNDKYDLELEYINDFDNMDVFEISKYISQFIY